MSKKYHIIYKKQFKKDIKRLNKQRRDLTKLISVIDILADGNQLSDKYHVHSLSGLYKGKYECHIEPDWLLVYYYTDEYLVVEETGTHSQLFK